MAQSSESKFLRSGTVSPVSVLMLNLQPKMCIPRMLQHNSTAADQAAAQHTDARCPSKLVISGLEAMKVAVGPVLFIGAAVQNKRICCLSEEIQCLFVSSSR